MSERILHIVTPFNVPYYKGWLKSVSRLFENQNEINVKLVTVDYGASNDLLETTIILEENKRSNFVVLLLYYLNLAIFYLKKNNRKITVLIPEFRFPNYLSFIVFSIIRKKNIIVRIAGQEYKDESTKSSKLRRWLLRFADHVIVLNQHTLDELKSLKAKPLFIPNPVDTNKFVFEGKEFKKIKLLTVGEICQRKNTLLVIDVYKYLKDKGVEVELTIIGPALKNDDYNKRFKERLNRHNEINWIEYTDNIEKYYSLNNHFIFPSEAEGMPNVLLEAMASGLFCVASNIPGSKELLSNKTGILINSYDKISYAESIYSVSVESKREMVKNALQEVKSNHSKSFVIEKYKQLISN